MIVKHLFFSLMDRLDGIEQELAANANQDRKQKLLNEIRELRKVSDDILDHWLMFEERMTKMQYRMQDENQDFDWEAMEEEMDRLPDDVAGKIFKEIQCLADKPKQPNTAELVAFLSGEAAHSFRKGQGYYNLFMYPQAVKHFKEVVEQDPDLDVARLFLAFSEMMNGELHEAERQFQLLSSTTDNQLLKAIGDNALGVLHAAHEHWDQALFYFEKAIEAYPKLKDPLFNKALVFMKQGCFGEAKPIWLAYSKEQREDWEVLLQLARCYLEEGEEEEAEFLLTRISKATGEPEVLFQVGQMFEDIRQFGNAALCYRMILSGDPDNHAAWHGLGWNLWHAEGYPHCLNYIKKAIDLSPNHPDYQFSYGWILYQLQELQEAEEAFRQILKQEGFNPLALAGLVHVYLENENWDQAKECCSALISDEYPATIALGHLQMGRLYLSQANYARAREHLELSIQLSPEMKDSYLLLGLIRYLQGEKEVALRLWEYAI